MITRRGFLAGALALATLGRFAAPKPVEEGWTWAALPDPLYPERVTEVDPLTVEFVERWDDEGHYVQIDWVKEKYPLIILNPQHSYAPFEGPKSVIPEGWRPGDVLVPTWR